MTAAIPASQLFNVRGAVLSASGNTLSQNCIFLTESSAVPVGAVYSFPYDPLASAVGAFFGQLSNEAAQAVKYFNGFNGATSVPSEILFVQYNTQNVPAYLRSASVASLSVPALQALSGSFTIEIDGRVVTTGPINLAAATSQSAAAALIQSSVQVTGGVFQGTAEQTANGVMTVTGVTQGELHVGDTIEGANVPVGTTVLSFGTGTGGLGTYNVSTTTGFVSGPITVSSAATCAYDTQRQAFVIQSSETGAASTIGYASDVAGSVLATTLNLTQANGAVLSQGADAADPSTFMNSVVSLTQNWVSFMTVNEQPTATKLAFAEWTNGTNNAYGYLMVDSDPNAVTQNGSTTAGYQVTQTLNYSGTMPIYDNSGQGLIGAFIAGMIASIDRTQTNGAIALDYKSQNGLAAQVTDETTANNLQANGYNFYGAWATRAQLFTGLQPGTISGPYKWADEYFDAIWLNDQLQVAALTYMSNVGKAPYNSPTYGALALTYDGVAETAKTAGVIEAGVNLDNSQIAQVNAAAGVAIDQTLFQQGYYISVSAPSATVRAQGGTPQSMMWYTSGGSIRTMNLTAINIQ